MPEPTAPILLAPLIPFLQHRQPACFQGCICGLDTAVDVLESHIATTMRQRDELHTALTGLLEAVYTLTNNDPTHYVVANTVGLPALVARQLIDWHERTASAQAAPRCPHGHAGCCGHHDAEDMPIHEAIACLGKGRE